MAENFWVGDIIQIVDHDEDENGNTVPRIVNDVNGTVIPRRLMGNNYNWYVTDIYAPDDELTLGAYSSFGLKRNFSHPLTISSVDAKMIKPTCRHKNTEVLKKVMPTCTESGLTEGKVCKTCGTMLLEQSVIPELGHLVEYDIDMGKKICTRCDWEESDKDRVVEFKAPDVRDFINIIEEMLGQDSASEFPPLVYRTGTLPESYIDENIGFHGRWSDDVESELKMFNWNFDGNFQFLTYFPYDMRDEGEDKYYMSAKQDGTTPLIIWLHDYDGMDCDIEEFEQRGLPAILSKYWNVDESALKYTQVVEEKTTKDKTEVDIELSKLEKLNGFYSYILCPRMLTGTWQDHKESFFHMIDSFVENYKVDTSKIVLIGEGMGGTGVEYFAYQKPNYFSCQIIIDGDRSGVNLAQRYLSYDYDPINGRLDEYNDRILPTRVIAKNDHYSPHFIDLNEVFGHYTDEEGVSHDKFDGSYMVDLVKDDKEQDEDDETKIEYITSYTFEKLVTNGTADGDENIQNIIEWALTRTNEYAEPIDNEDIYIDKENGEYIQVPEEWLNVAQNNVPVRKGAGEFFSKVADDVVMDYHQKIKLSKITRNGSELWGRLADNEVWLFEESEREELEKSGIWIDLSFTDYGLEPKDYIGYVKPVHLNGDAKQPFKQSIESSFKVYVEGCSNISNYDPDIDIEGVSTTSILESIRDIYDKINTSSDDLEKFIQSTLSYSNSYLEYLNNQLKYYKEANDEENMKKTQAIIDVASPQNSVLKAFFDDDGKLRDIKYHHDGILLSTLYGAPIYSAAEGEVELVDIANNKVTVNHVFTYVGEDDEEVEMHLGKATYSNLKIPDPEKIPKKVSAGTLLGYAGVETDPDSSGKYLVYVEWKDENGKLIDPSPAIQGLEISL